MSATSHETMGAGRSVPPGTVCLEDYESRARDILPNDVYEYLASGCADDVTLRDNRSSFDNLKILPRLLTDCSRGNTALSLFGERFAHPVLLAPVAHQALVHPAGELATAEAAAITETGMVASTLSSVPMEDIAARMPANKWFQLYFQKDRARTLELVQRAEAAGYSVLVVTVDAPVSGVRNRVQRSGFTLPATMRPGNLPSRPEAGQVILSPGQSIVFQGLMTEAPTWQDVEWLRNKTRLPIVLKGVLHPQDAQQCQQMNIQGLVVSNHGGRCLDTVPAGITMLPAIRKAVGNDFPVLLDGGIRRGTDVFKALALGANAVLTGRPQVFALAVAGALGVAHMLQLLRDELEVTMALAGCPTLDDIGPQAMVDNYPSFLNVSRESV